MSTYVITVYSRLIADICELSKVPIGAPDDIAYDWILIEGPKLDRALLHYIEGTGDQPVFPEWLNPLWEVFVSSFDPKYLQWLRQCLLFCYKIETQPSNEQLKTAQAEFENTEAGVAVWDSHFENLGHCPLFATARQRVGKCIYKADWCSIYPQHGPGGVFPTRLPRLKGSFGTVYRSIETKYGYADYLCAIPSSYWEEYFRCQQALIRSRDTIECRLVAVPKDSRGPRLICVHPAEAVWIQQGCRKVLESCIEHPRSPVHGKINFSDQGVNGRLALQSSSDREFTTLDLKEASDRISCHLVRYLFGSYAYDYISCSRASHVKLLDERVIELRKWAPMGNALTFPVQSLVFQSLVWSGIRCRYGIDCSDIYVFGDDIIFPTKYYDGALNALIRAGLIPNVGKTFRHGFFRESCGVDAYRGIDVTPRRLRKVDASSVSGAMSMCALAKSLGRSGYRRASDMMYRSVEEHWGILPLSNNPDAQGLYRYMNCGLTDLLKYEPSIRFNRKLHKWETASHLVAARKDSSGNDAWWHLQESLLRLHHKGESEAATRGLEYTVPHRERLQRGWIDVVLEPVRVRTLTWIGVV